MTSSVRRPTRTERVSRATPATESSAAIVYRCGAPSPFGHQRSGRSIATSTSIVLRPAFSVAPASASAPPPASDRRSCARPACDATTVVVTRSVARASVSDVCSACTSSMRAASQASSRTGRQTPLVTKRGPQSQP